MSWLKILNHLSISAMQGIAVSNSAIFTLSGISIKMIVNSHVKPLFCQARQLVSIMINSGIQYFYQAAALMLETSTFPSLPALYAKLGSVCGSFPPSSSFI
jgi:hypothetical protein